MSETPPRTVILLTTRTSATGSIWRASRALAPPGLDCVTAATQARRAGVPLQRWVPPRHGMFVYMNEAEKLNRDLDLAAYRFVLNARDPRDLLCNAYAWQMVHPRPKDGPGDLQRRAEAAGRLGIDRFVLRVRRMAEYAALQYVVEHAAPEDWIFLGYAMWCLRFDEAAARLAAFLGVRIEDLPARRQAAVAAERTDAIAANPRWIGNKWLGSDTAPGRHRAELLPATVATLAARFAAELEFLRRVDDPRMAEFYG